VNRWCFIAIAAAPLLLGSLTAPAESDLVWWTTHGLEKVRPYTPPPEHPSHEVRISAARNEFEPFQIVLRAENREIKTIDVDFSDLRGARDVIHKKNIGAYLEQYIDLSTPSSIAGGSGEWPDALIPKVDSYARERRNAFPFKLRRNRNQPLWIEVYVPKSTPAGFYRGNIAITISGNTAFTVPVELRVWDFALPSTSSLRTSFGFSGVPAVRQHYGRYTSDKDVADLTSLYQKAALRHRISLDGSTGLHPEVKTAGRYALIYWDAYDKVMAPFLNGSVFAGDDPLAGARLTSVDVRTPALLTSSEQQIDFWRQTSAHFRKHGWFDRLFNYVWDEPNPSHSEALLRRGEVVHRADPEIKNLITSSLRAEWSPVVDIWAPVINCLEQEPGRPENCKPFAGRRAYDAELSKGKELWWYQSCMSHGCNIVGGDYFRGWPSYMIDEAPVGNRIMEWLTWKYGVQGELYFNTNEAYIRKKNPWTDVYLFGGNGDGTLFYPGRPSVIGGKTDIPIESIRLKLIREGLEDYEYLRKLQELQGVQTAAGIVDNFVRSAYDFDLSPEKLFAARDALAREIEAHEGLRGN
jgi:hypothetical protein